MTEDTEADRGECASDGGTRRCIACGFRHDAEQLASIDHANHEAMHLEKFPNLDDGSRRALRWFVETAEAKEQRDEITREKDIERAR